MIADTFKAVLRTGASLYAWTRNKAGDAVWSMNVLHLTDIAARKRLSDSLNKEFNSANYDIYLQLCTRLGR